ncbi:MAG: hypothetical protein ACRC2O_01610, partial [Chitinophagaceae bacterium]
MQTELNHTVKSLFDKNNLDDLSKEDLLLLTVKYPYAAIFQFLYTRKLQLMNDLRFPASVAKTAIYFCNPHWLNHQLRAKTSVEALAEMEMAFEMSHAMQEKEPTFSLEENAEDKIELSDPVKDFPVLQESVETVSAESAVSETDIETMEPGILHGRLDSIMEDQISMASKPIVLAESIEIPLEPLYAVDYFAS